MTELSAATTVGDAMVRDFRSAAVFSRHGIDVGRSGRRSIAQACGEAGADPLAVVRELTALPTVGGGEEARWPPLRVLDRILQHHHPYVRRQIPLIQAGLRTLREQHGDAPPALARVDELFAALARDLLHHMAKEEQILFPYVQAMLTAHAAGARLPATPFGTIQNPVRMMEAEHQQAGEDLWLVKSLADGIEPPAGASEVWRECYTALAEFERDLHEHVYLENCLLFPAVTRIEAEREVV